MTKFTVTYANGEQIDIEAEDVYVLNGVLQLGSKAQFAAGYWSSVIEKPETENLGNVLKATS